MRPTTAAPIIAGMKTTQLAFLGVELGVLIALVAGIFAAFLSGAW